MMFKQKWSLALLVGTVGVTRWVFRSRYLYDLDSVNFALAMMRFDPRVHQPHPPGYFLYVCLGRPLNLVFEDANLALVVLSIVASCGAVVLIYLIALEWFGPMAALFAGVLFVFSPLAWFHGTVALTYIVEAFFSGLVGYLCWRVDRGRQRFVLAAAIALGLSAGVRPSSLLFLAPLFLFSLRKMSWKIWCAGLAVLVLTIGCWFVPMIAASGGCRAYFSGLFSLWGSVPSKETVFNSSPATSIARAFTIVLIYLLCFGAAALAPLRALADGAPVDREKKVFTAVWMLPALCFFIFGYLKFVNSGYLLLLFVPACLWLGLWVSEWYEESAWRRSLKVFVLGGCAVVNVVVFLASPFYCSYRQVRRFEAELEGVRMALPQVAAANDTMILSFDSHFEGFRHAGYYFPEYLTVEYPELKLKDGPRVFVMRRRDTQLVAELPLAAFPRFVVFPLPDGEGYKGYLKTVESKLPQQRLQRVSVGGHEFIVGSTADLPLLFPDAVPAAK